MNESFTLSAQPRTILGKKSKTLRAQNIIPGNVYGLGESSTAIMMAAADLRHILEDAGETSLVYIKIDGEKKARPVLVDTVDMDPITEQVLHVAFKQVNLKQKITAEVPVEVIGEVSVPDSTVVVVRDSIEVEALPTDLPEKFEIDVSQFTEVGQEVTLAQLEYDRTKVTLQVSEEELEQAVVMLQAFVEQAGPVEAEAAPEGESTAPVEGEATPAAEGGSTPAATPAE